MGEKQQEFLAQGVIMFRDNSLMQNNRGVQWWVSRLPFMLWFAKETLYNEQTIDCLEPWICTIGSNVFDPTRLTVYV